MYEKQALEQAKIEARFVKSNQSTPSKRREFSGITTSGAATNEVLGFSFGGPVADEGGVDFCSQNIGLMFLILISSQTVTVKCICVGPL